MAVLKYLYLSFGIIFYVFLNVISYTMPTFQGNMTTKILFSSISLILLILDFIVILKAELIFKKPLKDMTTYTKVMIYLGVIVIPLISLYYQS